MNDLAEIKKNEKSKEQRFYKEQFITSKNYDRRVYERKGEINGIRWRKLYVTG